MWLFVGVIICLAVCGCAMWLCLVISLLLFDFMIDLVTFVGLFNDYVLGVLLVVIDY